jgi:hypothetical protein
MKTCLRWIVAASLFVGSLAFAAPPEKQSKIKGKGSGKITVDDAERMAGGSTDLGQIDIEGRIHKPTVYYSIARADYAYTGIEMKQNFVDRIVRSALKRPF